MRTDGVVDFFPLPQLAIGCFHFQRARRDRIDLLGVGAVGAFHTAVEFRRTRGQHEQVQSALLAGKFELGGELTSAVDLSRKWRKACGVARYRGTGPRFESVDSNRNASNERERLRVFREHRGKHA